MKKFGLFFCVLMFFLSTRANSGYKVVLFFSTDCPICIQYTNTILSIDSVCKANNILFQIILPKGFGKRDADKYNRRFNTGFKFVLDKKNRLVKRYDAKISPQFFLIDAKTDEVLYSGAIDNLYVDIGKRRTMVTQRYWLKSLEFALSGSKEKVAKTQAIGCVIN